MVMDDYKVLFGLPTEQLEFLFLAVLYFILISTYLLNYFWFYWVIFL